MTRITGHRGARGLWPENSLVGFRKAITLGLDAIEFDVHLAASGELLVIHDAMLGRTTDGSGPVHALSPADRAGIRLNDSDETIPTLGDVLSVLGSGVGAALHVELKSDPDGHPYPGIADRVIAEIDRYGLRARCHLASFDITTLEECRRLAPDIPRLISVDATYADRQGGLAPFLASLTIWWTSWRFITVCWMHSGTRPSRPSPQTVCVSGRSTTRNASATGSIVESAT